MVGRAISILGLVLVFAGCPPAESPSDSGTPEGSEGGACYGNGTCDEGLVCLSDLCVVPAQTDAGSPVDSGPVADSGPAPTDAGQIPDAGTEADSGGATADSGQSPDAGPADGGLSDGGTGPTPDAGPECFTKCQCDPGEVCKDGICQAPPATCNSSNDCGRGAGDLCEANLCNGFTQTCFDSNPLPCGMTEDCVGRLGCENAGDCVCNTENQCVPDGPCTEANEDVLCGSGYYCDEPSQECRVLPACTGDEGTFADGGSADPCATIGMLCDLGSQQCARPEPCSDSDQCTVHPYSYCNVGENQCQTPTCLNGGLVCSGETSVCYANGACGPPNTGPCVNSSECASDPWPDTEYCDFSTGSGFCVSGCRSNADCPSTDYACNGARQCVNVVDGGGLGGGLVGDSCESDNDCISGLVCGLLTGVCQEICDYQGEACNGRADCCPISGLSQCCQGLAVGTCGESC
jgi:hypothetical protein